jgi:transposase-like protein
MPFRYSSEFRHQVCERMLAGEAIKGLVVELGVSDATLYKWRHQALIDAGRSPGLLSYEADRLAQARRRIKDLEDELKLVKAASALFEEGEKVSPKGSTRLSEG